MSKQRYKILVHSEELNEGELTGKVSYIKKFLDSIPLVEGIEPQIEYTWTGYETVEWRIDYWRMETDEEFKERLKIEEEHEREAKIAAAKAAQIDRQDALAALSKAMKDRAAAMRDVYFSPDAAECIAFDADSLDATLAKFPTPPTEQANTEQARCEQVREYMRDPNIAERMHEQAKPSVGVAAQVAIGILERRLDAVLSTTGANK